MKKNQIVLAALITMVALFAIASYFYSAKQTEVKSEIASQNNSAMVAAHSPRKGNPDAKVTIVEFVDPACETCKMFHPVIKELLAQYPTQINVVLRYAPFHHGSDQMVALLEIARKQGQFWNTLDLMFETQASWAINHQARPDLFWNMLGKSGIVDMQRMQQDWNNPEVIAEIQKVMMQDVHDGKLLGANKTPTFFVNGKPLPSFGYEQLMTLVQSELKANY